MELDLSLAMLRAGLPRGGWGRRLLGAVRPLRRQPVCGDIEQMPLAPASVELICSNLALPWVGRLDTALQEFQRVLARGGLLMFTTLGPDSLTELRAALGPAAARAIHPFVDMHDIGDLLVRSGFADPVMDMERLTLTYRDLGALLSELHAGGGRTARRGPGGGVAGPRLARPARGGLLLPFGPEAACPSPARSCTGMPGSRSRDRASPRTVVQWFGSSGAPDGERTRAATENRSGRRSDRRCRAIVSVSLPP